MITEIKAEIKEAQNNLVKAADTIRGLSTSDGKALLRSVRDNPPDYWAEAVLHLTQHGRVPSGRDVLTEVSSELLLVARHLTEIIDGFERVQKAEKGKKEKKKGGRKGKKRTVYIKVSK